MKNSGEEEPGEEKGKGLSGHRKWARGLALLPVSQGTGHRWWVTATLPGGVKRQLSTRLMKEKVGWPSRKAAC